jgi:hypothetical protein
MMMDAPADAPNDSSSCDGSVCNTTCTSLLTDPGNCGSCGTKCASGKCEGGDCVRRVFVTAMTFDGAVGIATADTTCNNIGKALPGNGSFMAWLGATNSTPVSRGLTQGKARYVLSTTNTTLWNSFAEVVTKDPQVKIDHDEKGNAIVDGIPAWTGLHHDQTVDTYTCKGWTFNMSSDFGAFGDLTSLTNWSFVNGNMCNVAGHLYCFEK